MVPTPMIFILLLIASFAIFAFGCWRRFSLLTLGTSEDRSGDFVSRLKGMFTYAFAQKRVVSQPFGFNHFIIFWAFIVLLIANGEFVIHGIFPSVALEKLPEPIYNPLMLLLDFVSLLALAAVVIAAIRRAISPPFPGARTTEAFFILSLIGTLMLAYFGINAGKLADGAAHVSASIMPVSNLFASFIEPGNGKAIHDMAWWLHAAALLIFMNYLPYSKHMHIMTAIPNCFYRRLEKPNTQPREEFVEGTAFGVDRVDRFSWKDLLDTFSCTECGRCQKVCPANITGKPLNPRGIIHEIKINLLENGPLLKNGKKPAVPLIGDGGEGSCSEESIWDCTTCGACMEACPVFIEQMPKIIQMRRYLVETEAQFPEELLNLFENMEGRSNPWGIAPSERTKWASTVDVKIFEAGKTEYLFYVGCAGAFAARQKHVTVALSQLLDKANISWGVLGKDEKCCGDSARRLGNEYLFDQMAKENVALFMERGVKKIITQCPHCFTTLKNDYRQYGLDLEVVHHAELLQQLVKNGKLNVGTKNNIGKTLFHDSCYLGRHNDVYEAPRAVIASATGTAPDEMERNHNKAFCCGAGGGRMWMEEHVGERINLNRVKEALAEKPDTICVSCPYCLTMFEDGLKDAAADKVKVLDVAEVLVGAVL